MRPGAGTFPGGTAVTLLEVYDWPCPDGLRGGSAHVHLASTEGYVVTGGAGRLQTLGGHGYAEVPLRPGDCLWFTPGTVHRLVNEGGLRILVVMQNAGLPEAGDAVLTFPPEVLADPGRYVAAAALPAAAGDETALAAAARARRDLAIEGYLGLREEVTAAGPGALDGFLAAAARLAGPRVAQWPQRWQRHAAATAALTGEHLAGLAAGQAAHLRAGSLHRIPRPAGPRAFGMCGLLTAYPVTDTAPVAGPVPQPGGAGTGDGGEGPAPR